ncbi:outer membrane protein transport protein [Pseudomonas sp.]|uniref:OmpP1/FadL family transporter n=1 Tax=Pseudomonas sp. TaxID=306 RepID=UPI0019FAC0F4|nr:outer membrane protein transport protein [Pseudomonas sp.]MBF0675803.1 TonB-dependent receptor [Pseudomonas sp.]
MKHAWIKTTLAITLGALSSQAMANGLAINEHSASGMGTAFAGRSSAALDASTVAGNPAGMSKLERREVSGGLAFIHAETDIEATGGTGSTDGDMVPFATVPFGYYVTPINDKMHFGLGLYVPFAVISDYEKGHMGRYHGVTSEVEVVNLQPTLSYKINDQVSVGGGLVISRVYGKLTSNVNPGALGVPGPDVDVEIEGDDIAYGYNLGVLVDLTEQLTWGLTYHSKVKYGLEGDTKVSNVPAAVAPLLEGKYDASVDITLPESVDTSVTYRLDDQWTLYGGATWTRWSRLDALIVENETSNPVAGAILGKREEPLKWEDTWSFAVGAAYQLNPQWVLRAGLALDESPTNDTHRTTRIPVSDRTILSFGAGWNIDQDTTLDLAYSYLKEDKGEVNQTGYNAEYENSAHGLAAQLTYRF